MRKLSKSVRAGLAAGGLSLATAAAFLAPAQAQISPTCDQYAWQVCSYDAQGNPIHVTFECYQAAYDECVSNGWGFASSRDMSAKLD